MNGPALDNRTTESLVAHELAHQWFGDLVVIKHWSHAWIKEGMASYTEVMWTEEEYGLQEAAYYRLKEARNYFAEDNGPGIAVRLLPMFIAKQLNYTTGTCTKKALVFIT